MVLDYASGLQGKPLTINNNIFVTASQKSTGAGYVAG